MFEIQSSKIASTKLTGPEKEFADHLIMDHTKTTAELTEGAKNANMPRRGDRRKAVTPSNLSVSF
jgi:predicted outer membrane protein